MHSKWGGLALGRRGQLFLLGALAALAIALVHWWWRGAGLGPPQAVSGAAPAHFVGAAQCASCHAAQHQAWERSQHAHSMQPARRGTVLAPFAGEQLRHGKVTSRFSREGDRFFVQTDGADGQPQRFEVLHTFGIYPLQQYLVALDGGKVQALATAWDSRPQAQGGQRWFHLQGPRGVAAGDELHWTQRQSNWNTMCAECHSTDFRKRYDPASRTFNSTFTEMNVACEACHGPGSRHLEWARSAPPHAAADKGLAVGFPARSAVSWPIDTSTGNARPSAMPAGPTEARTEVQVCARCHAHRSQEWPDHTTGQPLANTHRISRIEPGLFESDGQMRAEVFNHASFLQSKMFAKGVTCSHCHEPHSGQLRAPGNAVCAQCHDTQRFDTPAHHHHGADSAGAQCANCHLPTTTYMQVDPRHDHSIRVPRPDLSVARGTPNACSNCHRQEGTGWVAAAALRWYPLLAQRPSPLADALHAQERGRPEARTLLAGVVADHSQSAMARASALARLPGPWSPGEWSLLQSATRDPEGLLRSAAVELLQQAPQAQRLELLPTLVADPLRTVRMAAARALADLTPGPLSPDAMAKRDAALADYVRGQQANADRPEALNNLALLSATQGDLATARRALEQALAAAPDFVATRLNLADVLRAQGQDAQGLQVLEDAARAQPTSGAVWYALGLARHRAGQPALALQALLQASRRAPHEPTYAYALALAQDAAGQTTAAMATLQDSLHRHGEQVPAREALTALAAKVGAARAVHGGGARPQATPP